MPGNDLTASRALVPTASDTRAISRANLTTLMTNILDDIEPSVTPAQINVNSDLSFLSGGTKYAATNVQYLGLHDRTADTSQVESVYVKADELYYHDGAGNKVQLTSGGSAVAGSAGDITGAGYGAPVEINWHAGTAEYRFKSGAAATDLADLVMDKARFSDGAGTDYATLGAQSGMSGVVDFSLPLAVPAGTYVMTMDTSGNMAHTASPSVTNLTASGTVTATGDVTADDLRHTVQRETNVSGASWVGETDWSYNDATATCNSDVTGEALLVTVPLKAEDYIVSITVMCAQGGAGTLTAELFRVDDTGAQLSIASNTTTATPALDSVTLAAVNYTLLGGYSYIMKVSSSNGAVGVSAGNTRFYYTRP